MNSFVHKLNRHAFKIIFGGIFLFLSGLLYLTICGFDNGYHGSHVLGKGRLPHWDKHLPHNLHKTHTTFLVVLIMSGPLNSNERKAIRETWLADYTSNQAKVLTWFVVGTLDLTPEERSHLVIEKEIHNDMLLLDDFKDAYEKLSDKVLKSFLWLDSNVHYEYVLKADDDTFARVDEIVKELQKKRLARLYWGFFYGRGRVKRSGQWEEKDWFLCDYYLPYARGGGYVLSSDLGHYLASNADYFKQYLSEDVSVGTWLSPVNANRKHDPRFDTEYKSRGCSNAYIVTHKQSVEDMREKHRNLLEHGKLCTKEYHTMNSYIYNWNVPPSKCCQRDDGKIP